MTAVKSSLDPPSSGSIISSESELLKTAGIVVRKKKSSNGSDEMDHLVTKFSSSDPFGSNDLQKAQALLDHSLNNSALGKGRPLSVGWSMSVGPSQTVVRARHSASASALSDDGVNSLITMFADVPSLDSSSDDRPCTKKRRRLSNVTLTRSRDPKRKSNTASPDVGAAPCSSAGPSTACTYCSPAAVLQFPERFSTMKYPVYCGGNRKYTVFQCRKCDAEYTYCRNGKAKTSSHAIRWKPDHTVNSYPPRTVPLLKCTVCTDRKQTMWTRCEECNALYTFNNGKESSRTKARHFETVGQAGLEKNSETLDKLLKARFLFKCANTDQVTDKLISMTTQLLGANFFKDKKSLMQQVLLQSETARAVPTSPALLQSETARAVTARAVTVRAVTARAVTARAVPTSPALLLPPSASAPAMASADKSKDEIVKQQCSNCRQVTDHSKHVYRTKCLTQLERQTPPTRKPKVRKKTKGQKSKKPKGQKSKKSKKPKEYAVYTCLSKGCGAEYSPCPTVPTVDGHPLLQWTLTAVPGKYQRKIMVIECTLCKAKWTRCAEPRCKALYVYHGGKKGHQSVKRHMERFYGISEKMNKSLGGLLKKPFFTVAKPPKRLETMFRNAVEQLVSGNFFGKCTNKRLMNKICDQFRDHGVYLNNCRV